MQPVSSLQSQHSEHPDCYRRGIALILLTFAILGVLYSVIVPPFEASDELWHYPMVKYIADHWSLPVQVPGVETPWRQEGSQPPLYYFLMAVATAWIDTSDMEAVRYLNPHVDNGVATPDGNINLVVHDPAREAFPWRGTILALHIIRFLSVLMGVGSVYLTYRIVRLVLPLHPELALGAAAIHAFTPMFVFISASVNNDNLAVLLCNLAVLMILNLADLNTQRALVFYVALGVVLGLAALTKLGWPALAVLVALVVTLRALRYRSWKEFVLGGVATALPLVCIAGWWYWRNFILYGDWLGLNVFKLILGTREVPADLAQLWRERHSFAAGYWGNFGGLNVPMPSLVYGMLNGCAMFAALGLIPAIVRWRNSLRKLHLALCFLWGLGVFLPWALSWARDTWSSQGRLVFSAISTWSLMLALGVVGWFPRDSGRHVPLGFALLLFGLAVIAPFAWIRPAYALPEHLTHVSIPHPLEVNFGDILRLRGYELDTAAVQPGGQVPVTLYWEAIAPAERDYTVFVHLLGEGELLVAQRDTFPGLGRLSTTRLKPGYTWRDRYVLQVPDTAWTPDVAQLEVGLYDRTSGARVLTDTGADNVRFGRVEVLPRPGEFPNPIFINFGNKLALVGYELRQRVVRPSETIELILYWKALRAMDTDYTISVQVIDSMWRKAAQRDGWPVDGTAPTSTWRPGQPITDPYALAVATDAPPGVYEVRVVVYQFQEGRIVHLPTVPKGGRMQATSVTLTTIRVLPTER
ncbi:MAG: glycosyltransferase family 39 protein [Anaerolineae bacterium]|nr:glycosyltransferase family 39 protein [Anaerolineae bacterium]